MKTHQDLRDVSLRMMGLIDALEAIEGSGACARIQDSARFGIASALRQNVEILDRAIEAQTVIVSAPHRPRAVSIAITEPQEIERSA
jgi:hypothetical protein